MKVLVLLLSLLFLFSCARGESVERQPLVSEPGTAKTQDVKEGLEKEWEIVLREARKEGTLVISTGRTEAMRDIMGKSFTKKYGLEIQWMVGSGAQTSARLVAERRAGLYTNDISVDGGNTSIARYKQSGYLEALPPAFILPEVKDKSAWLDNKLPFLDTEGLYVFSMTLYPQSPLIYNTDLINPEEFSSYKKLLDPKWKGKFISADFTLAGAGLKWFGAMIEKDFGPILGLDYMKAFARQEPLIIRDSRLAGEWLMRGKYPFGFNIQIESQMAEYRRQGIRVPLENYTPEEGGYLTSGGQNLTFFKNAPHPNAAKVFINWILSREGARAVTRASIKHSTRTDIGNPKEVEPEVIMRKTGMKYAMPDQEIYLMKTDEYAEKATEIFGQLR